MDRGVARTSTPRVAESEGVTAPFSWLRIRSELDDREGFTMAEHVVVTRSPLVPVWRRGSILATVFVVLLALGAGTVLGTVLASDSSVTYRAVPAPAAQATSPAVGAASACVVDGSDGVSLLALIASMPNGAGAQLAASLSPPVRQLVSDAAFSAQYVDWGAATTPDAVTLAIAVAPLGVADRQVVLSSLAPGLEADVVSALDAVAMNTACR